MSAQLEIVFTDRGGEGPPKQSPSAPEPAQSAERTPGPSDKVAGPKKAETNLTRDLESAAKMIGGALGFGGLTGTAIELRRAFSNLYEAVTGAAHETNKARNRRADVSSGELPGEVKGPPASASLPAPAPPSSPSAKPPNPVGSVIRKPGQPPPLPTGITGPTPAPPVAGPAAAGSSAALIGRLAAAAEPAAVAIGVLTVAAVGGAIAIKRAFDVFAKEADRLSGFSAQLSGATARSDIRAEFASLRRANRIGPDLARVEDSTSRIQTKITDLNTEMLRVLLKIYGAIEPLMPYLEGTIGIAAGSIAAAVANIEIVIATISNDSTYLASASVDFVDAIAAIRTAVDDIKNGMKKDDENDQYMDAFLANFAGGMTGTERRAAIATALRGGP
ncbi:MAG: hypothetical protein ACREUY_04470 [Burkholderiales bacterium]